MPAALGELDVAIRLDPTYNRPYYVAYQLLEQAGEHERAMEYMRRLLAVNPGDAQARAALQSVGGLPARPTTPLPR